MSRLLVLLSAAAVSFAIAPAAPVPPEAKKPGLYFPTKVGTKWVYQTEGEKHESVEVVMEIEDKEGEKLVKIGHERDGKAVYDCTIAVSEKGLSLVETGISPLGEPCWLLKLPHKSNNKWDVVLSPVVFSTLKGKAVANGPEKIEVPAGKFEAIRVKIDLAYDDGREMITTWYAPGIGKVKEVRGERIEVLKSFTPGKD
jgi:hypothetical protein